MKIDQAHLTINLLVSGLQNYRIYPAKHPSCQIKAKECLDNLTRLLAEKSPLQIGQTEGVLFIDEHLFTDPFIAEAEALDILNNLKIQGLKLSRGLTLAELELFFSLSVYCLQSGKNIKKSRDLAKLQHLQIISAEDDEEKPRAVYNSALKAVDQFFKDIQGGRLPSTDALRDVSKNMVGSILREKHALFAMAQIKDYDNYTFHHSVNVGIISLTVGRACGAEPQQLQMLAFGGMVHDVGKLKVPIEIVNKPGRLNQEEMNKMRLHPDFGAELITRSPGIKADIVEMVHFHHVNYNRTGYPKAPKREISPLVDMVAIADCYDAMTTHRPYQRPATPREAIRSMKQHGKGTVLHPEFLDYFVYYIGEYPVGSLIRLKNGEIMLVTGYGEAGTQHLKLRRLFTAQGAKDQDATLSELLPDEHHQVVGEVNPVSRGIDVSAYLD
ncbi:MAG: HD domain-containing protein [Desulfuromonadales bacterium]